MDASATDLLGIAVPIVSAPLGLGTTPDFLRAMAEAGSLGFIGLTHVPPEKVGGVIGRCLQATGNRFGVNISLIGDRRATLREALAAGARTVSVWQDRDNPTPYVRIAKEAGAVVLWTVGSAADAARARDMGVDIVVAQGQEAGGHLVGEAPTMANLPAIVDASGGLPVIAAGGIGDGRGLAAALALGADAVWLGTRFVASRECAMHEGYKDTILAAGAADSVETRMYDVGWPDSPHRVLRNATLETWEAAGQPASGSRPGEGEVVGHQADGTPVTRYMIQSAAAGFEGDWGAMPMYAGASAALVRDVLPVRDIIATLMRDAAAASARSARLLG